MTPTVTLQTIRKWPLQERLDFLFGVWDQLVEDGWKPEPTDDLIAELDRRLAAHEANPANIRTWEQVEERARRPQ